MRFFTPSAQIFPPMPASFFVRQESEMKNCFSHGSSEMKMKKNVLNAGNNWESRSMKSVQLSGHALVVASLRLFIYARDCSWKISQTTFTGGKIRSTFFTAGKFSLFPPARDASEREKNRWARKPFNNSFPLHSGNHKSWQISSLTRWHNINLGLIPYINSHEQTNLTIFGDEHKHKLPQIYFWLQLQWA